MAAPRAAGDRGLPVGRLALHCPEADEMDPVKKENTIRSYLSGGREKRKTLLKSLVRPTEDLLKIYDPFERASLATEYLSVLDRFDAAMDPDEERAVFDDFGEVIRIRGFELTFDGWRSLLRYIVKGAVAEDPDVADLVKVAEVMDL